MIRYTASQMNTLMTLYVSSRADRPSGGTDTTYIALEDVWVNVVALTGSPQWYAQSLMPIANLKITMHYRIDLKAGMQLIDTNTPVKHTYRILQSPVDVENRHIYSQVLVQELEAGSGV